MSRFFEFSSTLTKLGFCLTFIINLTFISLTLSYTRVITGTYRKMLVLFAIICIVFTGLENISQPYIHNYNGGLVYFSLNESQWFSQVFLRMTLMVYSGCYIAQISFIAIQFLFRYFTVTDHALLNSFVGWKQLIWILYFLGSGVIYASFVWFCLESDDYSDEYMREEMRISYMRDIKLVPRVMAIAYDQIGNIRVGNVIFLSVGTFMIGSQYAIIIFCTLEMQNAMTNKLRNLSNRNRRLEKQFLKALVIQILLPTVLLTVPVGFVLGIPLLDLKINQETGLMFVLCSFYPPLDTMATMVIIKEYRYSLTALYKDLKSIKWRERDSKMETSS